MTLEAVANALPDRQIKVQKRYAGVRGFAVCAGLALVLLVAAVLVAAWLGSGLLRDVRLADQGSVASRASADGECSAHYAIFTHCDIDITYRTADGVTRSTSQSFMLFGSVDDSARFEVYYDKFDATIVTTSWQINALTSRWFMAGFIVLVIGSLAVASLVAGIVALRNGLKLKAAVVSPRLIAVTIDKSKVVRTRKKVIALQVWYSWDHDGKTRRRGTSFGGNENPLYLDRDGGSALAIAGPDGFAELLAADLSPLVLDDGERQAVMAALRGSRPAQPRPQQPSPQRQPQPAG